MVKKVLIVSVIIVLCAVLASCTGEREIGDNRDIGNETENISHSLPFNAGYYKGGEYMLWLSYTGNEAEHSYDVHIYESEQGDEVFLGMAYGVPDMAESITVPGYNNSETEIKISIEELNLLKIENSNQNSICDVLAGEYAYYGEEWDEAFHVRKDVITEGIYRNGEFRLTVTDEKDGTYIFEITDADGEDRFTGRKKISEDKRTTAFSMEESDSVLRFYKSYDVDGEFIEVVEFGTNSSVEYIGRYYRSDK